jgi:hypothetical protein
MTTKRPRTQKRSFAAPKRRTKTLAPKRSFARNPDQPIPEIARRYATNIVKRLWPSLFDKVQETQCP